VLGCVVVLLGITMSIYFLINCIIVFVCLLYSTITDIKKREVSNYITIGLLVYGTIANAIYFFLIKGYLSTIYFLMFDALVFLICYLLWKLGIFAGGDAKLFSGIAATIPILSQSIFFMGWSGFPFILSLFILSILAMFPIVSVKLLFVYFKRANIKEKVVSSLRKNFAGFVFNILYVVSLFFVFSFFTLPFWIFLIISIFLGFVSKRIRYPLSVVIFVVAVIINPSSTISVMLLSIVIALFIALMINLFVLSKSGIFNYKKRVADLMEGDLLAHNLIQDNKKLIPLKFDFWLHLKIAFKQSLKKGIKPIFELLEKRKHLYREIVINNTLAAGVSKKEISQIKKRYFEKEIELKETTPLVPSILLAYVVLIVFGDVVWLLVSLI